MNNFNLKSYVICLLSLSCLMAQPLMGEGSTTPQTRMMMPHEMTEQDLLNQMNDADKSVYQKLSNEGKALVLKMANVSKMNNNPMMMMQKCMLMMDQMMSKMKEMMDKKDMMKK